MAHPNPQPADTPSSEGDVLVKVENVGKIFCRNFRKSLAYGVMDGVGDLLPPLARKSDGEGNPVLRKKEFWANQGISFELRRGECLGLIGHNGAGKTTLLKMLNGLIKPDSGSIEMRGRVGALIALGAGFNPILTGRENIYINGSVYGMSNKEIDAKFDEIVDFAELWDFIDSPVQNYSSGMKVRLGFAVASAIEPDILLIDEVLAVGDIGFRTKCYSRINKLRSSAAVIFVSHSMAQVERLCENSILMSSGKVEYHGLSEEAVNRYNFLSDIEAGRSTAQISEDLTITESLLNGSEVDDLLEINGNEDLTVSLKGRSKKHYSNVEFVVTVFAPSGDSILQANSLKQKVNVELSEDFKLSATLKAPNLGSGRKKVAIRILDASSGEILFWHPDYCRVNVSNDVYYPVPIFNEAEFSSGS